MRMKKATSSQHVKMEATRNKGNKQATKETGENEENTVRQEERRKEEKKKERKTSHDTLIMANKEEHLRALPACRELLP